MSQLRHGARQALDYLSTDLDDLKSILREIKKLSRNPGAVEALADKGLARIDDNIKPRLKDEIEPRLQRAEPVTEQRLKDIEERLAKVEALRIIVEKTE